MWIKLAGAVLVVAACGGLGADAAMRLKKRLVLLERMRQMTIHLKGEILYANAPLAEAFDRTGRRNPGMLGEFFLKISEELKAQTGESFAGIWDREVQEFSGLRFLGKKEAEQLLQFGTHLGYLDRDMQEKTIQLYLEDLTQCIEKLRGQEAEKTRMFLSLGILAGLFLTVVLV